MREIINAEVGGLRGPAGVATPELLAARDEAVGAAGQAESAAQEVEAVRELLLATTYTGAPDTPVQDSNPVGQFQTFIFLGALPEGTFDHIEFYAGATGAIRFARYTQAGGTYTLVAQSDSVPVAATGLRVVPASELGAPFGTAQPGEFIAFYTDTPGIVTFSGGHSDPSAWGQLPGTFPGASALAGQFPDFRFQMRFASQTAALTAQAFVELQQEVAGLAGGPLAGKRVGLLSNSYGSIYNQVWQDEFQRLTGCVWWRQDARPGRSTQSALEAYGASAPLASLGDLHGYQGSTPMTGNIGQGNTPISSVNTRYQVPADGTSLADWLAPLDLLIIDLFVNDAIMVPVQTAGGYLNGIGTPDDAYTGLTFWAALKFMFEAILTAKPTQRILVVTGPSTKEPDAAILATNAAGIAACERYGVPYLDARKEYGWGPLTYASFMRPDGLHPSDDAFREVIAPAIARRAALLL